MTKKLAVPMLVLGLALYGGCGSSSSSNTGGSGGATGGAGGSTGGSGGGTGGATGGSGGGTGGATGGSGGGTGGATVDGGAVDTGAADTGAGDTGTAGDTASMMGDTPPTADFCAGYVAGSGMLAGKSAADFCAEYATVCTFTGDMRYMNMGDCVTKYGAASAAGQTCRAGHLCNAKTGDKGVHCPHATGLSVCQ